MKLSTEGIKYLYKTGKCLSRTISHKDTESNREVFNQMITEIDKNPNWNIDQNNEVRSWLVDCHVCSGEGVEIDEGVYLFEALLSQLKS